MPLSAWARSIGGCKHLGAGQGQHPPRSTTRRLFRTYILLSHNLHRNRAKGQAAAHAWPGRWLDADLPMCSRPARVKPRESEVHAYMHIYTHIYTPRMANVCICILPTTKLTLGVGTRPLTVVAYVGLENFEGSCYIWYRSGIYDGQRALSFGENFFF
jgi:hypothetical protein